MKKIIFKKQTPFSIVITFLIGLIIFSSFIKIAKQQRIIEEQAQALDKVIESIDELEASRHFSRIIANTHKQIQKGGTED